MNLPSNYSENLSGATHNYLKNCFEKTEGMISFEEAIYLYFLAKNVREGSIVEVGSYRGRSTVFLGRGSIDGQSIPVYAVDPHKDFVGVLGGVFGPKDRTAFYKAMLTNDCSEIVSLINLSTEFFVSSWKEPVSLLWVDGDHSYAGVKRDVDCWLPHLQSGGIIAFDDATDPSLGPSKLIEEMIGSGRFVKIHSVGKVVAICESDSTEGDR